MKKFAEFEVYQDKRKEWRWRLRYRNGRIVADSGEGYSSRRKCVYAVGRLPTIAEYAERAWLAAPA